MLRVRVPSLSPFFLPFFRGEGLFSRLRRLPAIPGEFGIFYSFPPFIASSASRKKDFCHRLGRATLGWGLRPAVLNALRGSAACRVPSLSPFFFALPFGVCRALFVVRSVEHVSALPRSLPSQKPASIQKASQKGVCEGTHQCRHFGDPKGFAKRRMRMSVAVQNSARLRRLPAPACPPKPRRRHGFFVSTGPAIEKKCENFASGI